MSIDETAAKNVRIWIVFAIVCLSPNLGIALHTLESPIREALLKPRNYNPHPYEQSYSYHNDYTVGINPNTIENVDNIAKNPFLNIPLEYTSPSQHPSNGVLSQAPHQFPVTLRSGQNSRSIPNNLIENKQGIYQNSLHGLSKKQYAFSYTVRDTDSGDDFSHTQQQKNGAVKGTYKVQLPDGRTQVVRYTADNDGYRADVSYLVDKNAVNHHNVLVADVSDQRYHNIQSHNPFYDRNSFAPFRDASRVFLSHSQFPTEISNDLEQRKAISAQPTHVVSAKSTHINDSKFISDTNSIPIVPESTISDNSIAFQSENDLYFKSPSQHRPFYHESG